MLIDYLATINQATRDKKGNFQLTGTTTQSFDEAVAALGDSGAWMAQLASDPSLDVTLQGLTITETAWNHDQTTLSPVMTALIGVIAAVVVPGIGGMIGITADSIGIAVGGALAEAGLDSATAGLVGAAVGQGAMSFASNLTSGLIVGGINGDRCRYATQDLRIRVR